MDYHLWVFSSSFSSARPLHFMDKNKCKKIILPETWRHRQCVNLFIGSLLIFNMWCDVTCKTEIAFRN